MDKKDFRFAFVSNSSAIAAAVQDYAATLGMGIEIRLATMEKAVPVARSLLEEGVEVILGGGATGNLLRQQLHKPVVTIARSHLDVIRALLCARRYTRHIALTCYGPPPAGWEILDNLLDIRIVTISFTTTESLRKEIGQAVANGVGCVVGGGICAEIARNWGCEGVVVTPSTDVMQRALEEAVNIAVSQRLEREQAAWLQGILDSLHEGIVGVDAQGKVITCNPRATQLLEVDARQATPTTAVLRSMGIPDALHRTERGQDTVRQVGKHEFIINSRPILVNNEVRGAVAAFRPVEDIRSIDRKLRAHLRIKGFATRHDLDALIGKSSVMCQLRSKARRFANTEASVLIQGETGTGKELLAHGIHAASPRCKQPFVAINCAALSENLLESELFGHDEGAFTGARRGGKDGLFTLANEGSIFLDEIGDISPALQALLLRVLESGEIMRVGGDRVIPVNVRVISSSWKSLVDEVRAGRFRADLYYRLTTLSLYLPPLRRRREDIPDIVHVLLARKGMPNHFSSHGLKMLADYTWPGNIRELEALVRRYTLLLDRPAPNDALLAELLQELRAIQTPPSLDIAPPASFESDRLSSSCRLSSNASSLREQLEACECEILKKTLINVNHNRTLAARSLGISTNTLWRKLKACKIF